MTDSPSSKTHHSLLSPEDGIPPNIGWVKTGLGLAVGGYAILFVYGLWFEGLSEGMRIQEGAATLILFLGFLGARRWPVASTLIALFTVLWEVLLSFFIAKSLILSSLGAFPVLVIASGMLFGAHGAYGMAALCGVGVPLTIYLSGAWGADLSRFDSAIQGNALIVTEMINAVTAILTSAALRSYSRAHATSERLRQRYMNLFQNAPDGLIALDEQSRIVDVNPAAALLLGTDAVNLHGAIFSHVLRRAGAKDSVDIRASKPGAPLTLALADNDGKERSLEITSRVDSSSDAAILLMIRDVTQRRALEDRLGHAQRLESVGRLAGGVAHDFNNLLTVVSGNASVLAEHSDPDVRAQAQDIMEAGERGANLTRQLLAFARRDLHRPVNLDLGLALKGMTRLLERLLGEQHSLEIRCDSSVTVLVDLTQLEQVVMNLVSNARDAMPARGVVSIEVRALSCSQASLSGSTLEVQRQAMLQVSDTGTGMSPEVRVRLFEPFFTTKPRGRGTGLGLASVHGIVAQSNGTVSVDTEPGQGTRFRVFLPLDQTVPTVSARTSEPSHPTQGGSEHILIVEDEVHVRALGARILTRAGYRVSDAANADEALLIADGQTDIALLVSDIVMPGMSGPQLAARIRDRLPKMKVLFISGHFEEDISLGLNSDPRRNLLTKPFNSEDLLRRVRTELDREW